MIECAGIRDETGMDCRIWRPGLLGFMLSMAVGGLRRTAISFSSPVIVAAWASWPSSPTGKVTSQAAVAPNRPVASNAPW